jgi:Holliday junction resolvasome RuvABC endonuclease subunit
MVLGMDQIASRHLQPTIVAASGTNVQQVPLMVKLFAPMAVVILLATRDSVKVAAYAFHSILLATVAASGTNVQQVPLMVKLFAPMAVVILLATRDSVKVAAYAFHSILLAIISDKLLF